MKTMIRLIVWIVSMTAFSAIIIVAGVGVAFIQRPVGAPYLALWIVWGLVTALGRQRSVASAYDKSQGAFTALASPTFLGLFVVAPWEYSNFNGPIPRDGPTAWVGLALFAVGIAVQA